MNKKTLYLIYFTSLFIVFTLFYSFDIKKISGDSMYPTLEDGQVLVINKFAYGIFLPFSNNYIFLWKKIKKNDIIVYNHPFKNKQVIKRCLATEGDTITINQGRLFINNKSYILNKSDYFFNIDQMIVPKGYVFAIGDNFDESIDSRNYGLINIKNIKGKAIIKDKGFLLNDEQKL